MYLSKIALKSRYDAQLRRYEKMFFKSYVFFKNSLKIALRGLDKEIQKKKFKITSTSQKWP